MAELQDKLNKAVQTGKENKPVTAVVHDFLEKMKPQLEKALPKHLTAERLARVALTTIRTNPQLLACSVPSLMGAIMQAAQLGLEPGLLGHCYIVPYRNKKTGTTEATFILGYKGMIDLARRSGHIKSIAAHCVYENDLFDYEYGLKPDLKHKPAHTNRGKIIAVYGTAQFIEGGEHFEVMHIDEIEKRRARSQAAHSGPWVKDFAEMAKKTVVRSMFKFLPISIEIQQNVLVDESVTRIREDVKPDDDDVIEMEFAGYDDETEAEQPDPQPEPPKQADNSTTREALKKASQEKPQPDKGQQQKIADEKPAARGKGK